MLVHCQVNGANLDELMKLRSSDVLNLVTSKLQNTTGLKPLLLKLNQPVEI